MVTGLGDAADLAVDWRSRTLYWSESDTGKIRRANFDGTGVEDLFVDLSAPTGIALDISQEY